MGRQARISVRTPLLATVLGSVLSTACAGKLDRPERFGAIAARFEAGGRSGSGGGGAAGGVADVGALPACVSRIFGKTCGQTGCHAAGSAQVDLASAGVTQRLVGQKSASVMCKDRVYVSDTGGASLLLDKLGSKPPCGSQMPLGSMLPASDVQCLTDWVSSLGGSPSDGGAMP